MALEQELQTFNELKESLLKTHEGKFALIKGKEFIDAFDNPDNAYQEGINRFGNEEFLVKRISQSEEVYRNQALMAGLINAHI
jgi:hypothetical protein